MPNITDRDIYLAARDLKEQYVALDELKRTPEKPQGERVMRPAPGPRTPASIIPISLDADCSTKLQEVIYNASSNLGIPVVAGRHGPTLYTWLMDNSLPISGLAWADDLVDELRGPETRIVKYPDPAGEDDLANRPEPYQLGEVIVQRMASRGVTVTREQLRLWAHRHKWDTITGHDGRARYRASEVSDSLNTRGFKGNSANVFIRHMSD